MVSTRTQIADGEGWKYLGKYLQPFQPQPEIGTDPTTPADPTVVLSGTTATITVLHSSVTTATGGYDGMNLRRSNDGGANWVYVGFILNGTNTYTDSGLAVGDYQYRVAARAGGSILSGYAYSNFVTVGTPPTNNLTYLTTDNQQNSQVPSGWKRVLQYPGTAITEDLNLWDSPAAKNKELVESGRTDNSALQVPILKSNTVIEDLTGTHGGKALMMYSRQASYIHGSDGARTGWTMHRGEIGGNYAVPCMLRMRLRYTQYGTNMKKAFMFWPERVTINGNDYDWVWELDFAETFGESPNRLNFIPHKDNSLRANNPGETDSSPFGANEQLLGRIDMTGNNLLNWHIYEVLIRPASQGGMAFYIDGQLATVYHITDKNVRVERDNPVMNDTWIPGLATGTNNGTIKGHFAHGSALMSSRGANHTNDIAALDWFEIWRPA